MRLIDIDDDRNCYCGECGEYERWNIDPDVLAEAQTERKKGTWKRVYLDHEAMGERPSIFYCSVCNQCIAYPVNFCPSCGSDMRVN